MVSLIVASTVYMLKQHVKYFKNISKSTSEISLWNPSHSNRQLSVKIYFHISKSACMYLGLLMGTGDFLSQVFVEKRKSYEYNFVRTLKFSSFGLFVAASSFAVFI